MAGCRSIVVNQAGSAPRMFGFGNKGNQPTEPGQPGPFGSYYLHELINSGGMAEIWLATNQDKQQFALRRLHSTHRFDLVAREALDVTVWMTGSSFRYPLSRVQIALRTDNIGTGSQLEIGVKIGIS